MFLGLEAIKLRPNIPSASKPILRKMPIFTPPTRSGSGVHTMSRMHGLGADKQKLADSIDSIAQGISRAVRGEKADSYSLGQAIPIQNVILIVGLGVVGYKLIELAVRGRH